MPLFFSKFAISSIKTIFFGGSDGKGDEAHVCVCAPCVCVCVMEDLEGNEADIAFKTCCKVYSRTTWNFYFHGLVHGCVLNLKCVWGRMCVLQIGLTLLIPLPCFPILTDVAYLV